VQDGQGGQEGHNNALKFALERFLDRREKLGAEFHDIPNSMKHADRKPDGWLEDHSPKSAYLTLAHHLVVRARRDRD
jgi:hypothetical protein